MRFENEDNLEKIPRHLNCKLAHNVLAVCDGFVARISKPKVCRATKLWRSEAWEWSEAE